MAEPPTNEMSRYRAHDQDTDGTPASSYSRGGFQNTRKAYKDYRKILDKTGTSKEVPKRRYPFPSVEIAFDQGEPICRYVDFVNKGSILNGGARSGFVVGLCHRPMEQWVSSGKGPQGPLKGSLLPGNWQLTSHYAVYFGAVSNEVRLKCVGVRYCAILNLSRILITPDSRCLACGCEIRKPRARERASTPLGGIKMVEIASTCCTRI